MLSSSFLPDAITALNNALWSFVWVASFDPIIVDHCPSGAGHRLTQTKGFILAAFESPWEIPIHNVYSCILYAIIIIFNAYIQKCPHEKCELTNTRAFGGNAHRILFSFFFAFTFCVALKNLIHLAHHNDTTCRV